MRGAGRACPPASAPQTCPTPHPTPPGALSPLAPTWARCCPAHKPFSFEMGVGGKSPAQGSAWPESGSLLWSGTYFTLNMISAAQLQRIRTSAKGSNASSVKPTLTHPQGPCCPYLSLCVPPPWLHSPPACPWQVPIRLQPAWLPLQTGGQQLSLLDDKLRPRPPSCPRPPLSLAHPSCPQDSVADRLG